MQGEGGCKQLLMRDGGREPEKRNKGDQEERRKR